MWNYSCCALQGRGHMRNQIPCQDKAGATYENGTYVIALSDGAGSAKLSHFGAELVVGSITELFVRDFDAIYSEPDGRIVKVSIMEKLTTAIKSGAEQLSCTPKDLAATMLVVAVKDDRFIIAHIGDGVIGYLDGNTLKVASSPVNGEHANETYFVTSADAVCTMKLFKGNINNIAGFVIMSDGTEHSLYNKQTNTLHEVVIKLMRRNVIVDEQTMNSQLSSTFENAVIPRTLDDCSIALLTRENSVIRPFSRYTHEEKCDLFMIRKDDRAARRRIARYDLIMELLQSPLDCRAISRRIHMKPRYAKRYLDRLCAVGLVKLTDGSYYV